VKCVQKAALQECVRAPALPVCTPVTLTHVVTVATGVRSAVQNLDIRGREAFSRFPLERLIKVCTVKTFAIRRLRISGDRVISPR